MVKIFSFVMIALFSMIGYANAFSLNKAQELSIFRVDQVIYLSTLNDFCHFVDNSEIVVLDSMTRDWMQSVGVTKDVWDWYHSNTETGKKSVFYNVDTMRALIEEKTAGRIKNVCRTQKKGFMKIYHTVAKDFDESGETE
jgi:hypothetical protein